LIHFYKRYKLKMTVTSDCLMSAPLTAGLRAEVKYSRPNPESIGYQNTSGQFKLGKKDFNKQFFEIYGARLKEMRPLIISSAREQLGSQLRVKNLAELREDDEGVGEEDFLIVGTVFKQQELKPSILKELSEEGGLEVQPANTKYTADSDTLLLEDENMRVKLEPSDHLRAGWVVNGVVLGVWGREMQGGKFKVEKVFTPKLPAATATGQIPDKDVFVSFLSGLELGGESSAWIGAAQLCVDWLTGNAGAPGEQEGVSQVERLLVCGDSLCAGTRDRAEQGKAKYLTASSAAGSLGAMRQLDDLLVQLCSSLAVDVMPGPNDPATCVLPQQPLHKVMFPSACLYPTLQSVSNPYQFTSAGRCFIVTSGQTISDILRNSELSGGPLEAMERSLAWAHLAPTTPDTLGCYPYSDKDPHIIQALPDVFVAGNQEEFATKTVVIDEKEVLLLALPKFSSSRSLIRLNLRDLQVDRISFDVDL